MNNLSEQIEKVKLNKTDKKLLNDLNHGISNELKEYAKKFNEKFQDLELREETLYRISNHSSNLFSKNVETSQKYRKMGNELYAEQRYEEALNSYNQALFYAPLNNSNVEDESNIDFALCLANRCAAFLQLKLYENCLTDINLAIKFNYPINKRKKLEERRTFCLEKLKDVSSDTCSTLDGEQFINLTNSTIELNTILAVQDLSAGQIVLEESSFCKTIAKLKYYERCFNCLKITGQYIYPCRNCSQVKFCSELCSNDAWSNGHFIECNKIQILDIFKSNYSFEHIQLALKSLLKIDLNLIFKQLRKNDEQINLDKNEETFLNILNKIEPGIEFDEKDYRSVAQIVTYLIEVFQIPKKLINQSIDNSADYELFGAILARLLNQLQKNATSISERDFTILSLKNCPYSEFFQTFKETEIGKAFFPIYNMIQHDLDANCQILKFTNNKLIISALREIKNGEQLTINKYSTDLNLELYKANKSKYLKFVYRNAFKCIKCLDGAMCILNEQNRVYLDCLKCEFNCELEIPEDNKTEKKDEILDKINEMIATKNFCIKQSNKSKLLLYSKQPNLITVEHNLLESYRELKKILYSTNQCLADVQFDLSVCYLEMRMYLKSIKHSMNAFNNLKSHFTINELEYLNGLIRLINIQYYFVEYTNSTSKELDDEHRTLYNFNLNELKENLNFLIENSSQFLNEFTHQKLIDKLNERLNSIQNLTKK